MLAPLALLIGLVQPSDIPRHAALDLAAVSSRKWDRRKLSVKDPEAGIHGLMMERPSHDAVISAKRIPELTDGYVVFTGAWSFRYVDRSEKDFNKALTTVTVLADPFR